MERLRIHSSRISSYSKSEKCAGVDMEVNGHVETLSMSSGLKLGTSNIDICRVGSKVGFSDSVPDSSIKIHILKQLFVHHSLRSTSTGGKASSCITTENTWDWQRSHWWWKRQSSACVRHMPQGKVCSSGALTDTTNRQTSVLWKTESLKITR